MKNWMLWLVLFFSVSALAQQSGTQKSPADLRKFLLTQLQETHNEKNWFVSEKEAVAGLTPAKAAWSDGKNHSVGQLVQHLNFWNAANFAKLQRRPARQTGNNDETFDFDPKQWPATLKEFDQTMAALEQFVGKKKKRRGPANAAGP